MPAPIRARLEAALLAAARDPEVQARQHAASIASRPLNREETMALLRQIRPGVEAALVASGMTRRRG
jgi:tripartite-type tricarboxylate transporter receptor subunit TctC